MAETPFRIEVVTVTGLTVATTFTPRMALIVAASYLEDEPDLPLTSPQDRIGLRTVLLRLYGELLAEAKRLELLDEDGVAWLIPAERVLAVRVIDPERSAGPPREEEVRQIGFQLRPTVAGSRREPTPIIPATAQEDRPAGRVSIRPKAELD